MTTLFKFRSKMTSALAVILIYTTLMVSNSFAHNIDLDKAWEIARDYARLMRTESNGKYLHYATNCVKAFPGHNHYVRCIVQYQNEKDAKARVWTCKETIEIYFDAHRNERINYTFFYKHTSSNICGVRKIDNIPRSQLGI